MNPSLAIHRDTTSPGAMVGDLRSVLLGNVLSSASRGQLRLWMEVNLTGLDRLRAKLPKDWRAADKTGSISSRCSWLTIVSARRIGGQIVIQLLKNGWIGNRSSKEPDPF